ncbi:MAG: ABC transporter substrate-binding protein [Phototrophicaceae bacterium]
MRKLSGLLITLVLLLISLAPAAAQDRVTIVWYIGLGTGAQPEQQDAQQAVVDAFNASQDRIELVTNVVENTVAYDTLSTLIAAGDAPDLIGPVGNDGANAFGDFWLDISPYLEEMSYDLTQFPEALVDFYRTPEGGLEGLPLATYPSMIFYRPDMFEEAGLNLPPSEYGEPYVMPDGTEVAWSVETLREIGMILTVDANGNDATMEGFDPENIVQWGFDFQWYGDGRQIPNMWGAARLWNPDTDEAQLPENWAAGYEWWYDGMWEDFFIPNAAQEGSDLLGAGNVFNSGNLAMAQTHLWYTCCIEGAEWNVAPIPSYEGVTTVRLHADTFRIYEGTEHPAEAVEVLTYLTGPAALDLLAVYGGMPAREDEQADFFAGLDEQFSQDVHWEVAQAGLQYADSPSHEAWFPNYLRGRDRVTQLITLMNTTPGLDLGVEFASFVEDMQAIFDAWEGPELPSSGE